MLPEQSVGSAPSSSTQKGNQNPARQRWLMAGSVALFIFLSLTAVQTARLGAAGFFVQIAQFEIDRWTSASSAPGLHDVNRVAGYFSDSLTYATNNPWALEGLGALELASMRASRVPQQALAATRDSHKRFRQALVQRPTSPFLWANVALAKLYLNEIDDEFLAALRHADELGPWEPASQQTILFVGLAAWQELDPALRQALVRTIERGALRNARKMFEIVKSYRRFDLICAISDYRLIAGPACGKPAAAAKEGKSMKGAMHRK
jgi:hypothetical protein